MVGSFMEKNTAVGESTIQKFTQSKEAKANVNLDDSITGASMPTQFGVSHIVDTS